MNDASKDASIDIIEKVILEYADCKTRSIKIVQHSSNKGLSIARQSGIDASTGKYVVHVGAYEEAFCAGRGLERYFFCIDVFDRERYDRFQYVGVVKYVKGGFRKI